MNVTCRILLALIFVLSLLFLTTSTARAEAEFQTSYKVRYQIDKDGQATVTQNITLENRTPNFYADQFELKIGSTKITNVKARDQAGDLESDAKFENNITTINVKFNDKVIGQGKKLTWTLAYTTNEIATKSGQIWEISIPKLSKTQDLGSYEVTVSLPRTLGPEAFTIPQAQSTNQTAQLQEYTFTKDQLIASGIAMSFGEKQVFSFNFKYYLENSSITSQTMDITLPPDNNYQKIVLEKIEPKPLDVVVDDDGNFLAKYRLIPKEKVSINVNGQVEVFSKPTRKIIKSLTDNQKNAYTQPQRYWEVDNSTIKEKAAELKTPERIYQYVADFLAYNNGRLNQAKIERKGAATTYTDPKDAICTDFTDLFIALSRAAKIPAREVQGYAYTQNERLRPLSLNISGGDVLHAWPEYWDNEKGWVQIDPTWGSTSGGLDYFNKLDFNHITFVQRGLSSISPYPAGAFKAQMNEKTVFVQFAQELPAPIESAIIDIKLPKKSFSSLPFKAVATLTNTGSTSIIGNSLKTSVVNLDTPKHPEVEIPILPPFAKKNFTFNFQIKGFLERINASIIFSFADVETSGNIQILPIYKLLLDPMFILGISITLLIVVFGLLLYKKLHPKPKIHPQS